METIIKRIEKYLTSSKISTRQFEIAIGTSNGAISRAIKKGTDIQSKWLSKIIDTYTDINPEWLLIGKGNMKKRSLKEYQPPEKGDLAVNEEKSNYLYIPKNLFNKLKDTGLTDDQLALLRTIENNYDMLLNQNIGMQNKIIQLYENKDL